LLSTGCDPSFKNSLLWVHYKITSANCPSWVNCFAAYMKADWLNATDLWSFSQTVAALPAVSPVGFSVSIVIPIASTWELSSTLACRRYSPPKPNRIASLMTIQSRARFLRFCTSRLPTTA